MAESKTSANKSVGEKEDTKTFSVNRIRQIMKSSPEVAMISNEAVYLVKVATEMFITMMASKSFDNSGKALEYKQLASFVQKKQSLDFLLPILPQKITVKQYREIMEKENKKKQLGSDEDTSSEESGSEEEESGSSESGSGEEESDDSSNSSKSESVQIIESDKDKKKNTSKESEVIELDSDTSD